MLKAASPLAAKRLIEALDAVKYIAGSGRFEPDWDLRVIAADKILDRSMGKPDSVLKMKDEDGNEVRPCVIVLPAQNEGEAGSVQK